MNGIVVRNDEPFERAIRRFSKTCEKSGVLSDLKKFRHYEKPSEERRRKNNSAKRKLIRQEMHKKKSIKRRSKRY